MSVPLVSIIVPLYGDERFAIQALSSIDRQTYPNMEVILIADGSREHICKMIEPILHDWEKNTDEKNIKFHFSKEGGKNLPEMINLGLKLSSGTYLTILNSNDFYHPERISTLIQKVQMYDLDFVFTRVIGIDVDSKSLIPDHPWRLYYETLMFNMIHFPTLEFNFLKNNLAVCYGNLLFSRKLYELVGGLKNFKHAYSHDFILRAIQHFEIHFVNEELYYTRIYDDGALYNDLHAGQEELKQIQFDYLVHVSLAPPSNQNAPSPSHWPQHFYKIYDGLRLNDFFIQHVQKSSLDNPQIKSDNTQPLTNSKRSKKITLVSHDLALGGGAPRLLLDLALELKHTGFSPQVFSLSDGPLKSEFQKHHIPVEIVPKHVLKWKRKYGKLKRIFLLFRTLLYINLKTSRHIIINSAASWPFALPFSLFSWFKNITWYVHESYSPMVYLTTGLAKKLLCTGIAKQTFSFWFGSDSTKNIWASAVDAKGKTKYWSGIPNNHSLANKNGPIKNLLAVGTSHPRKGTHYIVDAFISCVNNKLIGEDVTLTIIGIPDKIDPFNAHIILKKLTNNLQNRIQLISCISSDEIGDYYRKADLFIQASILECMPLSLLQAMAEGLPIISTDVNGCSEAIEHHATGYLCRPFSSTALAEAITEAVQNFEQARELGRNGQQAFNKKFARNITMAEILKELKCESLENWV